MGLEKALAPHSSTLAWKLPWVEEPGRLQSMGSLRVGYDWAASLSLFTFMHWRRKWRPTPVFLPGESQGRQSLVGCVYGVTQSLTWLKRLSRWDRMPCSSFFDCWLLSPFSLSSFTFIKRLFSSSLSVISMVSSAYLRLLRNIDISPSNLDSSLCFIQASILHDVLCI